MRHQIYNLQKAASRLEAIACATDRRKANIAWRLQRSLTGPRRECAMQKELELRQAASTFYCREQSWKDMAAWGGVSVSALKRYATKFGCGKKDVRLNMEVQAWRAAQRFIGA